MFTYIFMCVYMCMYIHTYKCVYIWHVYTVGPKPRGGLQCTQCPTKQNSEPLAPPLAPGLAPGLPAASNPNGDPYRGRASETEAYHYSSGMPFSSEKRSQP